MQPALHTVGLPIFRWTDLHFLRKNPTEVKTVAGFNIQGFGDGLNVTQRGKILSLRAMSSKNRTARVFSCPANPSGVQYYGFSHSPTHTVRLNPLSIPNADLQQVTPTINKDERWKQFYQAFYLDPMRG